MKKILITCVHYHNLPEVMNYITHINQQTVQDQIDIVITDNCDQYEGLKKQVQHFQNVYCFNGFGNLGYIHGLNYGLTNYLKTHEMPEWIVLSNTDITYESNSFYEDLLNLYPKGYNSAIAPSIYSTSRMLYQNPLLIERYKKVKIKIFMFIFKYPCVEKLFDTVNNIKNKFQKRKNNLLMNQTIYSGHGACLILNKRYFLNGGNLNYGSFLFGEEIYIAEMVKKTYGTIYFDNRLKVTHHEHTTVSKEKRKKINQFYFDSMCYLYNTFYV